MKLEWFRTHKNFVYWILLPLVGGTMVFYFGPASKGGFHLGKSMPSVSYTVDNTTRVLGPNETLQQRMMMTQYPDPETGGRHEVDSHSAGSHMVKYQTALDAGFETGKDEMVQDLLGAIKSQIRMHEPGTEDLDDARAKALYQSLLDNIKLTPAQFESLTHQYMVREKWIRFAIEHPVSDGETFAEFCRDKEVVRLRYKELKSSDYDSKTTAPTVEKVTEFYNKHKDDPAEKELLFAKPAMSADFFYYDTETLLKELKPTPEELKKYYDDNKAALFKKELKQGEQPPPPGKEEYKPFDEIKPEVEKKWLEFAKRSRPGEEVKKLMEELEKEEKAWNDEQDKKKPEERKPFDMDEFAKKHNLKHWVTKELTEAEYDAAREKYQDKEKAPEKEIGASDSHWVSGLFHLGQMLDDPRFADPKYKAFMENIKKQYDHFAYPEQVDPVKQDKGLVTYRKKVFNKEHLMTLDEAKPAIEARLKTDEANELAKKDAEKLEQDWKDGKNLPDINTLEEVSAKSEDAFKAGPLARQFFDTPKAVGEVLVATGPEVERKPGDKGPANLHKKYFVGFAVERQLPTVDTFDHETKWDRTAKRQQVAQSYRAYIYELLGQDAWRDARVFPQNVPDPSVFEGARRGGDDY
jgi:hypothetical protein